MKKIGILAHGAEGAALCFITACREGQQRLGPHMHPEIILSASPLGLSLSAWESGAVETVARVLRRNVELLAEAGADFFICPNNTAHDALQHIAASLPIPGLHIAEVVCAEIIAAGYSAAGLLGSKWTMTGPVYEAALERHGIARLIPDAIRREAINRVILDELCQGRFVDSTTDLFIDTIKDLRCAGADCVILGCTEIPLIINDRNSPIPPLDSTRLLARYAVAAALSDEPLHSDGGWLQPVTERRAESFH